MVKLQAGKQYRVEQYRKACDPVYRNRLLAMGFIPGATFKVLRIAPLGDPVQVEIKGFLLSLRNHEASCLLVQEALIS